MKHFKTPYVRVRGGETFPSQSGSWRHWRSDNGGTPYVVYAGANLVTRRSVVQMTDTVVPGFKAISAAGGIVNNPMTKISSSLYSGGGSYTATNGTSRVYGEPVNGGSASLDAAAVSGLTRLITSYDDTKVIAQAKLLALANIDATPYAFFEDLLEIRETIEFLRNPLSAVNDLSKAAKAWRKKKFGAAADSADAIASAWTQYRFAISPLIRSANNAWEAYKKGKKHIPKRRTAHGSWIGEQVMNVPDKLIGINHFVQDDNWRTEVHASILYEATNPILTWQQQLGLRNKDLPETLWNIVSLSFMVDRLIDISSSIKGLVALSDPSINILCGSVRKRVVSSYSFSWIGQNQPPPWSVSVSGDTVMQQDDITTRYPWIPSPSDAIPPIKSDVFGYRGMLSDVNSIIDLVALIQTNWGK